MTYRVTRIPAGTMAGGRRAQASDFAGTYVARATFDPTSSTQILLATAPAGSRVVDVLSYGGGTGGTNPTVDIGTSGTTDGFANELAANIAASAVAGNKVGTLIGTLLTVPTPIYGKVGASAATGGTTTVALVISTEAM